MDIEAPRYGIPKFRRPKWPVLIAVILELTMFTVFITLHSRIGVVCAIAYAPFSGTWAFAFSHYHD